MPFRLLVTEWGGFCVIEVEEVATGVLLLVANVTSSDNPECMEDPEAVSSLISFLRASACCLKVRQSSYLSRSSSSSFSAKPVSPLANVRSVATKHSCKKAKEKPEVIWAIAGESLRGNSTSGFFSSLCRQYSQYRVLSCSLGNGNRYFRSNRLGRLERPGSSRSRKLVEPARALSYCTLIHFGMMALTNDKQPVVVLKSIKLIKEVTTRLRRDDGLNVFQDKHAR